MYCNAPITDSRVTNGGGERPLFLGVDVGGTYTKLGLLDTAGRTLMRGTIQTQCELGPDLACQRISRAARRLVLDAGASLDDVARVGLATPGAIHPQTGILLSPGNLPGWSDFPIAKRAADHFGLPVTLANDANAAAYGEYWKGAGNRYQNLVFLTLGTGIGGGIIVGGKLMPGSHNCGCECGYIIVDPSSDAPCDALGKRGTLEAFASAKAVVARACQSLDAGQTSSLAVYGARRDLITPQLVAAEAERGDALARSIVMESARYLALGIATLIHAIDPEAVLLGGAMNFGGASSSLGREFLERIRDGVRCRLIAPLRDSVQIEFASLGGEAGFVGAAGLAQLEYERSIDLTEPSATLSAPVSTLEIDCLSDACSASSGFA